MAWIACEGSRCSSLRESAALAGAIVVVVDILASMGMMLYGRGKCQLVLLFYTQYPHVTGIDCLIGNHIYTDLWPIAGRDMLKQHKP